jgi:hypothetical protein
MMRMVVSPRDVGDALLRACFFLEVPFPARVTAVSSALVPVASLRCAITDAFPMNRVLMLSPACGGVVV